MENILRNFYKEKGVKLKGQPMNAYLDLCEKQINNLHKNKSGDKDPHLFIGSKIQ